MEWILVMFISDYDYQGVFTERFKTEKECNTVGYTINTLTRENNPYKYRCVEVSKRGE